MAKTRILHGFSLHADRIPEKSRSLPPGGGKFNSPVLFPGRLTTASARILRPSNSLLFITSTTSLSPFLQKLYPPPLPKIYLTIYWK